MTATDLWPPSGPRSELLARLAAMIDAGGAAHFLDAPVARADAQGAEHGVVEAAGPIQIRATHHHVRKHRDSCVG